jgi:ribose 5-phosphate isomerase B
MRIALASDHAGYELKEVLKAHLISGGHEVEDSGAHALDPADDYPDFIVPAAHMVSDGICERAIVLGGSGQGEAMAANRVAGVRAVVYYGEPSDIIRLSREHNDANVLSLGARFLSKEEAVSAVDAWLGTPFSEDERHARRIAMLDIIA